MFVSDESNGTSMIAARCPLMIHSNESSSAQVGYSAPPRRLSCLMEPSYTCFTNATEDGDVIEVFVNGGEGDDDMSAMCTYVGRLISTALKYGVPLEDIVKQGNKVPEWRRVLHTKQTLKIRVAG